MKKPLKIALGLCLIALGLCLLTIAVNAAEKTKYILNYKRLSTGSIAISCANGGDPTGVKVGEHLIIDCGK